MSDKNPRLMDRAGGFQRFKLFTKRDANLRRLAAKV